MKKMLSFLFMLSVSGFASTASTTASWGYVTCHFPWEEVKASDYAKMCRLSVPHGWLILNLNPENRESASSNTTIFISDESHEWVLNAN
jgi:hypothetical protein